MAVVSPIGHHYNTLNSNNSNNFQINVKMHSLKLNSASGSQEILDSECCDKRTSNRSTVTRDPGNPILYCIACCLLYLGTCNRRCCGDFDDE